MRVIVAGSRDLHNDFIVYRAIRESGFTPSVIMSGCAAGVDESGERWAAEHGIQVEKYPADWTKYGVAAGPLRNCLMAAECDAAIVVLWEWGSRGSEHMIREMRKNHPQKPLHVVRVVKALGWRRETC